MQKPIDQSFRALRKRAEQIAAGPGGADADVVEVYAAALQDLSQNDPAASQAIDGFLLDLRRNGKAQTNEEIVETIIAFGDVHAERGE